LLLSISFIIYYINYKNMKRKFSTLLFCLLLATVIQAQTWNGSASTDWNTAANWTPAGVPLAAGNVTIPNTVNKPKLASNVTINNFTMNLSSGLDFNGFTLTSNGAFDINGATLSNSNGATDISITLNGTGILYFRQNVVNDNIIINHNSTSGFFEGYQGPNIFNGNVSLTSTGTGSTSTSYDNNSTYNGNLTITRTVAGLSEIFRNGAVAVTGNFSYTNNAGGNTLIHQFGTAVKVPITGTVNITATGSGNPTFLMRLVKNNTTGGTISVQNSGFVTIANDTLAVTALNINGYTDGNVDDFLENQITGTVNISDAATNTGSHYFRGNTINGNTTITVNSVGGFLEGYQSPNTFNGNLTINSTGTGTLFTSYDNNSTYNGNLTINRTGAGISEIFRNGAVAVTGNFSYTNNAGGNTLIHPFGTAVKVPITGTVNITATGSGNPTFLMRLVKNNTTGGTISVQNSGFVTIANDTLAVTAFNVNGYTSNSIDDFIQNQITGTVNISDDATNTNPHYFRGNTINGNTTFTVNSVGGFYEAYQYPNTFNGNTTINCSGTAYISTSYDINSTYNGDVTINRTGAGISEIFRNGAVAITGNFSYTNNAGGNTFIHQFGTAVKVPITGTVNITATGSGNPTFLMRLIKNNTTGGTISVQNSGFVTIANDTLAVSALNINGYTDGNVDDFLQNQITGTVNISDAATNTNSHYFRGNIINGNTTITTNAPVGFYESYQYSNTYNGNLTVNRNNGNIFLAYDNPSGINQDLTLNSATGITFTNSVLFGGSTNAAIEQLGIQPIIIPLMVMQKTGSGTLTLNDSVTISTSLNFTSNNIISTTANHLKFLDNAIHTGASASSHVIGAVTKVGDDLFTFPVGTPVSYNAVTMSAPVGATSSFRAQYKNQNPGSDGYNTSLKAGSFGAAGISKAAYWDVQRLIGTTNVSLTLGFGTNLYEQYPVLANLKVAHWNGAQWDDHGNGGTTGTAASGTVVNSVPITSFSPFTLAGITNTYFYTYGNPGTGPDGTPVKFGGIGGYPSYQTKQLPGGTYTADSIYLIPNASTVGFKLKDFYGVEKDDTTVTAPIAPTIYISANGNGTKNFTGWRHFVYMTDGSNNIMGAIKDNDLTLGNTTMTTYFSTANVATAPNGNIFLKRSFKITSQFAPVGLRRVRLYISKTEFTNLVAADPASFPSGINSLTITKYTGPQEDSLFNPIPGGNAIIIPNSDITIVDLGTMYSLDIDVTGFSGFYIGGNQSNLPLCSGSTISIPSNISGATYQWQVDNGGGYVNVTNGGVYSGATASSLTLTNAPGSLYGYKYRCVVNGGTFSQVYTIKFTALWQGTVSNVWENTANWSCGILPDANTDVILSPGKPNFPQINSNVTIRTLKLNSGSSATVKTGFTLTILK
jgi:hypothetical protein